jgi:hypothetical protein
MAADRAADPRAAIPPGVRRYDLADRAQRAAFEQERRLVYPRPERFAPGEAVPPQGRYREYVDYGAGHEAWIWDTTDPAQVAHAAALRAVVAAEQAEAEREEERARREAREACVPALGPQGLTDAEFDLLPEKLEYWGGEGDHPSVLGGPERGRDLLRVLLKNLGLREVVPFAPKGLWQQALDELP